MDDVIDFSLDEWNTIPPNTPGSYVFFKWPSRILVGAGQTNDLRSQMKHLEATYGEKVRKAKVYALLKPYSELFDNKPDNLVKVIKV